MVIIDVMIVNIALPDIAEKLHANLSGLQWVAAGYTLTFASLLLSAGDLGDRFGAKRAFIWGLVLFVLTSLGCGLAFNLTGLIIFRFLQGAAASLLVPTSLALIHGMYENPQDRARAIGVWASIAGLAGALGPILGGILTSLFGWRAVFLVNIPIGLVAFFLTWYYVPQKRNTAHTQGSFDLPGQILGILSIAALAFSLIEAGTLGLFSPLILTGFAVFIVAFLLFLLIEYRASAPMFPLTFFRHPVFSVSIAVGMILNIGGYGIMFVLPLYFQQIRGYSVLMAGLALVPFVGLGVVGSYIGGRISSMIGPRLPMVMGTAMGGVGFFAMLIAGENGPAYTSFLLPLIAIGLGCSVTMPAITIAILHAVPTEKAGMASGALNASRQTGSFLGVAVFGTIVHTAPHFVAGMHTCLIIAGGVFLGATVLAYLGMR